MKILLALDNDYIKNKLKEDYKNRVYEHDIALKEDVIEILELSNEPYIIITKDTLKGKMNTYEYIEKIVNINKNNKVIYIVEKLNNDYKKFLFSNEVFNILEGNCLNYYNIKECIESNNKVVYKNYESKDIKKDDNEQTNIKIPKQLIAVYGTSGAGKSIVSSIIAKKLAKELKLSIALLDMDVETPTIDIINNIYENEMIKTVEGVDKNQENYNIVSKHMIKDKSNKHLWYMVSKSSLFDDNIRLSDKYYKRIYDYVYDRYTFSIIDLPSSPFLDVVPYTLKRVDKILFVINANYISIRQAIKHIDLITKLWNNENGKIYIVVNKVSKNSLELNQIESLLGGYKIIACIKYNKDVESYINGAICNINLEFIKDDILKCFGAGHIKKEKVVNNRKLEKLINIVR